MRKIKLLGKDTCTADFKLDKYEYCEHDWAVICEIFGLDPNKTTKITVNDSQFDFTGDVLSKDYETEMSVDKFIDVFGIDLYKKMQEKYLINDYDDHCTPVIVLRNYKKILKDVDDLKSFGIKGSLSELIQGYIAEDFIASCIIRVSYKEYKEEN